MTFLLRVIHSRRKGYQHTFMNSETLTLQEDTSHIPERSAILTKITLMHIKLLSFLSAWYLENVTYHIFEQVFHRNLSVTPRQ